MNQSLPMGLFLVIPMVFLFVILLVILAAIDRWRREKHRLELQKAILERVSSVKDLGEFLTTEQGDRFLGTLAAPQFRPQLRILSTVGVGIVFLIVGMFLMFALHTTFLGVPASRTPPPALLMGVLLLVAIGVAMLISAVVSFFVARRLGLDGRRRNGSK